MKCPRCYEDDIHGPVCSCGLGPDDPDPADRPTTVINVSRLTRDRRAALAADPSFVYCGRAFAGWPASVYGNPFKGGMGAAEARALLTRAGIADADRIRLASPLTVAQAVACYRLCWTATPGRREKIRAELRGKVLGCWCVEWGGVGEPARPCHAVELARIADGD
jgi:hypothetical protein